MTHGVSYLPISCGRGAEPTFPMFLLENLRDFVLGPREFKVLFTGLTGAGASTFVHILQGLEDPWNREREYRRDFKIINYKRSKLLAIDGESRLRECGKFNVKAIVYVVDSSKRDLLPEVKEDLFRLLNDPDFKDCKLLIFNNKIDKEEYISSVVVIEKLGLMEIVDREWYVQSGSALYQTGIRHGLDRLYQSLMGQMSMFQERKIPVVYNGDPY